MNDLVATNGTGNAIATQAEVPWHAEYALATKLSKSGIIPTALRNRPDDVFVVLMTGRELGIGPMLALRSIYVLDGKPTLSADLAAACVLRSAVCEMLKPIEMTEKRCVYQAQRKGDAEPTTYTYTIEDAKQAGLAGKQNWQRHPKAMLRARCCMNAARGTFPDLVAGVYDPDEIDADEKPRRVAAKVTTVAELKAARQPVAVSPEATAHVIDNTPPDDLSDARREAYGAPSESDDEPPADVQTVTDEPEWKQVADVLIGKLDDVKAKPHLVNHKKKYAAEYAGLKEHAPELFAIVVEAGKRAAERSA